MKTVTSLYATAKEKLSVQLLLLQKRNLQKKNRRELRIFDNCDFLPAWRYFKVHETDDKRYLLDCDRLPEYDEKYLIDIWDKIIIQFDKITGENKFENFFLDINTDLEEYKQLIILKACYQLMLIGREEALSILMEAFGIDFKRITHEALQTVRSKIARIETNIKIEQAEKPIIKGCGYIESVVRLSNTLNRQIDHQKITTTEWIFLDKEAKELLRARKDGRSN